MTHFFAFSDLTWPEVAGLSRQLPLVLPLGRGYSLDLLAQALGNPEEVGLLPALPFGWKGSLLPVDPPRLAAMLGNLLGGLREDGFERLILLCPEGVDLPGVGLAADCLALPGGLPTQAGPDLGGERVILVPIGHTEQHGFHLPLSTDTVIIEAIGQGTAAAVPDLAVSLPVMPYGVSTHRRSFAGTFNAGGRAFEDFWLVAIDRLVRGGARMIYLLSGHGGSCSFLTNVVKYAGEQHPDVFSATSWLYLSGPKGIEALETRRRSSIGGMGHACELETALMMALRPDLVHLERAVDETDFIATPSYYMDWVEGGALVANPPWEDDTPTGAYGAGSLATAENGRFWLEAAIAEKVSHVHEIREQHHRRAARRAERGNQPLRQSP